MRQQNTKNQIHRTSWTSCFVLTLSIFCLFNNQTQALAVQRDPRQPPPRENPLPLPENCTPRQLKQMSDGIKETLATAVTDDADFSFYVQTADGREISFSRGNSDLNTSYESASTSKWVSGVIILSLVDQGYLSLNSKPQDFLSKDIWPIDPKDPLYNIRLRDLLSFTSGLTTDPACINNARYTLEACVKDIAKANANNGKNPGAEFWYGSAHLQVAGLMAVKARGAKSWQDLFSDFQARTKLFPTGSYDLPSKSNPRLAGGMHWTGNEYVNFIKAYYNYKLLSPRIQNLAMSDQLAGKSINYDHDPAARIGEDWHYGFALWLECHSAKFNCEDGVDSYSSPGTYGAYPFMNVKYNFYGILARQGRVVSFPDGYKLFNMIQPELIKWAAKDCTSSSTK